MDLSFLLGGGGGVRLPDPVQQYGNAMSLAQLARQNRVGSAAEAEQMRLLSEQDAYRKALPALLAGNFSPEAVLAAVQNGAGTMAVSEADKRRKAAADEDKTRAETADKRAAAVAKTFDHLGGVAFAEAKAPDKLSLSRVNSIAERFGVPLPSFSGDPNDPAAVQGYLKSIATAGFAVKDQVHAAATDRAFDAGEVERMWRRQFDTGKQDDTRTYQQGTLASQAADRSQRMTIAKMVDDRTKESTAATRENTAGQRINTETQSLAKMVDSNVLPNLVASGNAVESMLAKYKGKDIPGMGATRLLPDLLISDEGKDARSTVQGMANDLLKLYSGGAVTLSEDERRTVEMMAKGTFTDNDFRNAWPRIKARVNEAQANIRAGYSPEAVQTYEKRGGGGLKPIGSGGSAPIGGVLKPNADGSFDYKPGG